MATKFREPNQVLWRGVRPGHNGVPVKASNNVENDTKILKAAAGGLTVFICTIVFSVYGGVGRGYLFERITAGAIQHYIVVQDILTAVGCTMPLTITFDPPYELLDGNEICIQSSAAGCVVRGFLHGWEE